MADSQDFEISILEELDNVGSNAKKGKDAVGIIKSLNKKIKKKAFANGAYNGLYKDILDKIEVIIFSPLTDLNTTVQCFKTVYQLSKTDPKRALNFLDIVSKKIDKDVSNLNSGLFGNFAKTAIKIIEEHPENYSDELAKEITKSRLRSVLKHKYISRDMSNYVVFSSFETEKKLRAVFAEASSRKAEGKRGPAWTTKVKRSVGIEF